MNAKHVVAAKIGFWALLVTAYSVGAVGVMIDVLSDDYQGLSQVAVTSVHSPEESRTMSAAQLAAVNDFAAGMNFERIFVSGAGYTLTGARIALNAGVESSGTLTWGVPITLTQPQSLRATGGNTNCTAAALIDTNGHALSIQAAGGSFDFLGTISGTGGVSKTGSTNVNFIVANTFAGTLNVGPQSVVVQGIGLIRDLDDIRNTVLGSNNGVPVLVSDVARVEVGNVPRLGIAGHEKDDDVVLGVVLMRRGEQTLPTIRGVQREVERINAGGVLPPGVRVVPLYDREDLVKVTTRTVVRNIIEGVALIVWAFRVRP